MLPGVGGSSAPPPGLGGASKTAPPPGLLSAAPVRVVPVLPMNTLSLNSSLAASMQQHQLPVPAPPLPQQQEMHPVLQLPGGLDGSLLLLPPVEAQPPLRFGSFHDDEGHSSNVSSLEAAGSVEHGHSVFTSSVGLPKTTTAIASGGGGGGGLRPPAKGKYMSASDIRYILFIRAC